MPNVHLHHSHAHHEEHFAGSDLLSDIIIGMSDGLTVPFALAAGLSGAVSDPHIILTAGMAEIIAGSIAMGLGGYLSGRTEIDHYKAELVREHQETELYPELEKQEVRDVFKEFGLSHVSQNLIVDELSKNRDKWVEFMMRFELGLEKPDEKRATRAAFNIGASYIVGGIIPLMPYVFSKDVHEGFYLSVVITLMALTVFGYFKSKVIGQSPWKGALQTAAIGAAAAATAYAVAKMFN